VTDSSPEQALAEAGIALPEPRAPAGAYLPTVRSGAWLFVAGQVAADEGELLATGLLGAAVEVAAGQACARQCTVNVLAQAKAALGELSGVERVAKINVYVASDPLFTEQHLVANGASELVSTAFGERGRHARSAVGAASLPMGTPVEVDGLFEVAEPGG
jgi:enamine deaminase RidA (YjgF/YER057c/UK114 family)